MADGRACSEERAKAIKGCVDENGVTGSIASGLRSPNPRYILVHTRRPR